MDLESSKNEKGNTRSAISFWKKRNLFVGGVILGFFIILILILLRFKPKPSVTTVNYIKIKGLKVSLDVPRLWVDLNVTLTLDVSVKNPNKAGFKYGNGSTLLYYRGDVVGEAEIPDGEISAGETIGMNTTLTVLANRLVSKSEVYSDVISALDKKLYAIGGVGSNSSDPRSWDTYDPSTNSWSSHSDPNIIPDIEESIVLDGKIYIRCGASSTLPSHVCAVVYKPLSGTWQHADKDMVSGWSGPAIVVDGTLYVLDQSSGTRLMMWQKETKDWVAVGRLSPLLTRPPCRLAAIGKRIFVIGKGLSTVVFDVGRIQNRGAVIVSSSIPKLDIDADVISCKVLSI